MKAKLTISAKHPLGAIWVEGVHGWEHLPGADISILGFPILGVNAVSAEFELDNNLIEMLYDSAATAEPVQSQTPGCKTCD